MHVRELGMQMAPDAEIFERAAEDDRVLVSTGTPTFGTLLAIRKQTSPSVILFRHGSQHRPADQAALLKSNLPRFEQALKGGCIVVANHSSHADTAVLLAALPSTAKPVFGAAADYWFAVPTRRIVARWRAPLTQSATSTIPQLPCSRRRYSRPYPVLPP